MLVVVGRKPTSRYEVMQLRKTMDTMLDKVGFNDEDFDIKGPTQVGCPVCWLVGQSLGVPVCLPHFIDVCLCFCLTAYQPVCLSACLLVCYFCLLLIVTSSAFHACLSCLVASVYIYAVWYVCLPAMSVFY